MRAISWLVIVGVGCGSTRLDGGSDAAGGGDSRGDDDIHPIDAGRPDAAVVACTPSAWALETVAQWTDDTAPLAPQLRVAGDGIVEIDYPTSPQAGWGGPRRAARRTLDGAWTIAETPSVGRGTLARLVGDDGVEHVCHERHVDPG